jgi:hypothetical protein
MNRLLVHQAADGSSLTLYEQADHSLAFRKESEDERPKPLSGVWSAFWVAIEGEHHVVCVGDSPVEGADRVMATFPHATQRCPVRSFPHHRGVWMSFPEPFEPGMVITARWLDEDRVLYEERWQDDSTGYAPAP